MSQEVIATALPIIYLILRASMAIYFCWNVILVDNMVTKFSNCSVIIERFLAVSN